MPKIAMFRIRAWDLNALARKGFHFCASCGKQMKYHYSGHCAACRRKGYD